MGNEKVTNFGDKIYKTFAHVITFEQRGELMSDIYSLRLFDTELLQFSMKKQGLSLNDSFWVVPEGFKGTFSQYNLYENCFSEILALVAYTGAGGSHQAFTTSPELTTGGMLQLNKSEKHDIRKEK